MSFEKRFKQILLEKNLTASAMADQIGVQASTLSHILSGRNKPSVDILIKLKNTYPKIDLDWLLIGIESNKESALPHQNIDNHNFFQDNLAFDEDQNKNEVEKIVFFYKDGRFKAYQND